MQINTNLEIDNYNLMTAVVLIYCKNILQNHYNGISLKVHIYINFFNINNYKTQFNSKLRLTLLKYVGKCQFAHNIKL